MVRYRVIRVFQVSTFDRGGGAEKVAWNLFRAYRQFGFPSWLAVGYKCSNDPDVLLVPNDDCRSRWARAWITVGNVLSPLVGKVRVARRLRKGLQLLGQPRRLLEIHRGHEDFDFPGTWRLLDLPPERPDIVHCHNLHGGFFDLRALPWLSHQVPVVLTLHDAWLLSGHCAHSFGCERWKTGCGNCPDLTIYPSIKRDATAYNWQRKRDIYAKSRLYVATPSLWLMKKVEESILSPAIVEKRVIPNGIDLSVFRPGNKELARASLGLPQNVSILLFVGHGTRSNPWKDYTTMESALVRVASKNKRRKLIFLCLGEKQPEERFGVARIRFVGYQKDPMKVAQFYQAADVYIHAARAETFPNTVLEALACGIPVVATAVGGIPEQVEDGKTGFLVPPKDAEMMASRIEQLLSNDELRKEMGTQAVKSARSRFDIEQQVSKYLDWYKEILVTW